MNTKTRDAFNEQLTELFLDLHQNDTVEVSDRIHLEQHLLFAKRKKKCNWSSTWIYNIRNCTEEVFTAFARHTIMNDFYVYGKLTLDDELFFRGIILCPHLCHKKLDMKQIAAPFSCHILPWKPIHLDLDYINDVLDGALIAFGKRSLLDKVIEREVQTNKKIDRSKLNGNFTDLFYGDD